MLCHPQGSSSTRTPWRCASTFLKARSTFATCLACMQERVAFMWTFLYRYTELKTFMWTYSDGYAAVAIKTVKARIESSARCVYIMMRRRCIA